MLFAERVYGLTRQLHVAAHGFHKVVAILEAAGLESVAKQGDILVVERLHDEVGDHAAVLGMHVGSVCIKDSHHADIHAILAAVVRGEGFGATLALVVARADADCVHIAPIALDLRMHEGIAIYLACGGMKDLRLGLERQVQHVHHAENAGLHRLDGVVLVVDRAGRAGEVVDFVELSPERLRHIVQHEREPLVVQQLKDVVLGACKEIVEGRDLVAFGQKPPAKMPAQEAGAAGDQCFSG